MPRGASSTEVTTFKRQLVLCMQGGLVPDSSLHHASYTGAFLATVAGDKSVPAAKVVDSKHAAIRTNAVLVA